MTSSLPICWTAPAPSCIADGSHVGFAGFAIVAMNAYLDQFMRVQRCIDFARTDSESPFWLIETTGLRPWARARSAQRSSAVSCSIVLPFKTRNSNHQVIAKRTKSKAWLHEHVTDPTLSRRRRPRDGGSRCGLQADGNRRPGQTDPTRRGRRRSRCDARRLVAGGR